MYTRHDASIAHCEQGKFDGVGNYINGVTVPLYMILRQHADCPRSHFIFVHVTAEQEGKHFGR